MLLNSPDYIIITLLDNKTQKVRDKDTIPEDFNLLQDEDSRKIMIPVQNIIKNQVELEKVDIEYKDHPLELAFAFTVQKVKGLIFDKIILALEPLKGKNWTFENLYVGYSRIRTNNGIRCLPLSQRFDRRKFLNLCLNISTMRWRINTTKGNK